MNVSSNVNVHSPRRLMNLDESVSSHRIVQRVNFGKVCRCCKLAGVVQGVAGYVVLFQEILLHASRKVIKSGTSVSKSCSSATPRRWQFVCQQK
jgi:hypothetical protein